MGSRFLECSWVPATQFARIVLSSGASTVLELRIEFLHEGGLPMNHPIDEYQRVAPDGAGKRSALWFYNDAVPLGAAPSSVGVQVFVESNDKTVSSPVGETSALILVLRLSPASAGAS